MSVSSRRQTPTWPFLVVIASLFALSLTAPRKWEKVARSKPLMTSAKRLQRGKSTLFTTLPFRAPRGVVHEPTDIVVEPHGPEIAVEAPAPSAVASRSEPARVEEPTLAPSEPPAPRQPLPDLGAAMSKLAPPPSMLGPDGQVSLRVPADLSPVLVMRPEKPAAIVEQDDAVLRLPLPPAAEEALSSGDAQEVADEPGLVEPSMAPDLVLDESLAEAATPGFAWSEPKQLLERLEALTDHDGAHAWAYEVIALIHELLQTGGPQTPEAEQVFASLDAAVESSSRIAGDIAGPDSAELQRVAYALKRRLAAWKPLSDLPQRSDANLAVAIPEPDRLALCLNEIEVATQPDAAGRGWRDYLLFDNLQSLANGSGGSDATTSRLLAQRVLARLTASRLSKSQRRFVADDTLSRLASELRCWAAEPIDGEQILAHLEAYESEGGADNARLLAADLHQLAWSPSVDLQNYGRQLEQSYRNANLRMVVSEELLSRMMPPQPPVDEPVRVTILGAPTRGRSHTETDTTARLIPDPHRLRFLVEARGRVTARTNSQSGPATVYSNSHSTFEASREMEFTLSGLHASEMLVSAHSRARLRDVSTSFDSVPVVGSLVTNYAKQRYSEQRATAERELERLVAQKAVDNIAAQSSARTTETNRKLQKHLLEPMARLEIEPTIIETQTTDDRMTIRLRIAGDEQLGAHTARPRAPGHSLLSAQIHESAINNFITRLKLGGKLVSERQLYESLSGMLGLPPELVPAELHDNVLLYLNEQDPIRVRFQDGRIAIELKVDELRAEGETFRDFMVRVYYCPDPASPNGDLMRDGTVQLIGRGLRAKGQIALRGMFSKTFNKDRRLAIMPEKLSSDPRMAGIKITQWVVADGWIGIAVSDVRPGHSPVAMTAQKGGKPAKAAVKK